VQMNSQWPELFFLYYHYEEYDNAALTMINHSSDAWDHALFKDVLPKVANTDICYKAVQFYLGEQPMLINDLMVPLSNRVDHGRVVQLVRKLNQLPLVKPYLLSVQEKNIQAVNDAVNELHIEEEDFQSLRYSIDHYDAFDALALAQTLESHDLLEFRRVSAYIYKNKQLYQKSVELSKKDKLYKDAIQTAAESKKSDIAEPLVEFFVQNGLKECFAAALYTCYDVVRPDVALEYAWRYKLLDYAFPFFVQAVREYTDKVDTLFKEFEKKKKDQEKKQETSTFHPPEDSTMYMHALPQIAYYDPSQMPGMGGVGGMGGFGGVPGGGFGGPPPGFGGGFH